MVILQAARARMKRSTDRMTNMMAGSTTLANKIITRKLILLLVYITLKVTFFFLIKINLVNNSCLIIFLFGITEEAVILTT